MRALSMCEITHCDSPFLFTRNPSAPFTKPSRESVAANLSFIDIMPPRRTSSAQSFNANILEPDALTTRGGLEIALRSIERVCYHDDSTIMHMITELVCRPHVFEYIMSSTFRVLAIVIRLTKNAPLALYDQPFERLSKWAIARFPAPDEPNVMEAFGVKLLQRLSSSILPAERVVTAEQRNELRELRRKSDLSLDALKELDGCADRASADVNVSQTSRKRPKAQARNLQLDPYPFDCVGIPVPTTEREVRTACGDILLQLKGVFGVRVSLSLGLTLERLPGSRTTSIS